MADSIVVIAQGRLSLKRRDLPATFGTLSTSREPDTFSSFTLLKEFASIYSVPTDS